MASSNRPLPAVGGRRLVGALGGFYVVLAAGYPIVPGTVTPSLTFHLVVGVLGGGPGLVLLYGGYRLPRTEIRPELFPVVARWSLGGVGIVLGVLLLTTLAAGLTNLVTNVLILTALGSVAGFVAGVHNARARTRERGLRETAEQLRTSNERLEQFAYAASHDLQEPLRMVSSYLRLLENRYEDELDEEARDFIGFAVGGADRMRVMVERLLEYSRVTNSGDPLEPTDTEAVLRNVRENLRVLIEETGTTITADELPTVPGDAAQLALVFRNLLSNAVKHRGRSPRRYT